MPGERGPQVVGTGDDQRPGLVDGLDPLGARTALGDHQRPGRRISRDRPAGLPRTPGTGPGRRFAATSRHTVDGARPSPPRSPAPAARRPARGRSPPAPLATASAATAAVLASAGGATPPPPAGSHAGTGRSPDATATPARPRPAARRSAAAPHPKYDPCTHLRPRSNW